MYLDLSDRSGVYTLGPWGLLWLGYPDRVAWFWDGGGRWLPVAPGLA
jgi:hypothetical protein